MDLHQKDRYIKLGLNLAYYRKLQGFTQESLAEKANISILTIARLETGTVGATLDMIFKITDAMGIEAYKLFQFRD